MKKCPQCGRTYSDMATACPCCGCGTEAVINGRSHDICEESEERTHSGMIPPHPPKVENVDKSFQYSAQTDFLVKTKGDECEIKEYIGNDLDVVIPPTIGSRRVTVIGSSAFRNNGRVRKVTISPGCKVIASNAFQNAGIEEVVIPESLTSIGAYSFCKCTKLKHVQAHSGIKKIGGYAFCGCKELKTIDFGAGEMRPGEVRLPEELQDRGFGWTQGVFSDTPLFGNVWISKKLKPLWFDPEQYPFGKGCRIFYYEDYR